MVDKKQEIQVVLATTNQGKLREIQFLTKDLPVQVKSLADFPDMAEVVEDADTFRGNAEKKARTVHKHTGLIAIADDSGLCVDYLKGAPGVFSARYAGENATDTDNNTKLVRDLSGVLPEERGASFFCCVCIYPVQGKSVFLEGKCSGTILESPRGENGFGYDPYFYYEPENQTFAQLPAKIKNRVSHRARAFAEIGSVLESVAAPQQGDKA